MCFFKKLITAFAVILVSSTHVIADYWSERENYIDEEAARSIGATLELTEKEKLVDNYLMGIKLQECREGFANPDLFLASQHFFKSRAKIEESPVFKMIQKLPKGASLHSHDTALASEAFVFNLTYSADLYGCINGAGRLLLKFMKYPSVDGACKWQPLKDMRSGNSSFDDYVKTQISIVCDNPLERYPNGNVVWGAFIDTFITVNGMLLYKPVFEAYFYQALKELREDNVMYVEFRGTLPDLYDLNGRIYRLEEVVQSYVDTLKRFQSDYPDFFGARFIYAPQRHATNRTMDAYAAAVLRLKGLYPDFIAGFDLVGQEDLGRPLEDFANQLLAISDKVKFFFHAGETNWNGEETDTNLVDAVLLNTTRIGHGYAAVKHPGVLRTIKERHIALEVSPISNQVLRLVDDIRNHPAAFLIANDYPVVICCDDPSFWGAKALSYDWYIAFMGLAHRGSGLKLLKQLAINSLEYSSLDLEKKQTAMVKWKVNWQNFIDSIVNDINSNPVQRLFNVDSFYFFQH